MGEGSPYQLTFVVHYKMGDEPIETETIKIQLPIK